MNAKYTVIAAALIATTTISFASEAGRDRPFKLKVVQCMEPEQGHVVEPQPPAYLFTLQNQAGDKVNWLVDNQFAIPVGIPNSPRFYGTQFDSFVSTGVAADCQDAYGDTEPCVVLNVEEIEPGERTDGVNARQD